MFFLQTVRSYIVPVSAKTTWIILELCFEDGLSGWGEATLSGAEAVVQAEIDHASSLLVGRSFAGAAEAVALLGAPEVFSPRLLVQRALEQAFLDAIARAAGITLATLLGGPARCNIPVYANINRGISDRSAEGFATRAREVVSEEAYTAVKIAPFDGLEWSRCDEATGRKLLAEGIGRILAVREAIGPQRSLLVDCHSRLSPVMARTVIDEVGKGGLYWLEEALSEEPEGADAARALRHYANDRGIQLAGGERVATVAEARQLLARECYDAILPDIRWTGIRSALSILELAASWGVGASLHNPAGPVLDRISMHVAAASASFLILERQVRESPLFEKICGKPESLSNGSIVLNQGPGFGAPPVREVLKQLEYAGHQS
jgi:galactonate dehydratase